LDAPEKELFRNRGVGLPKSFISMSFQLFGLPPAALCRRQKPRSGSELGGFMVARLAPDLFRDLYRDLGPGPRGTGVPL
jgi:hypothetical protein